MIGHKYQSRMYQPHLLVLDCFDPLLLVPDVMRTGHTHSSPYDKTKSDRNLI